MQLCPYCTVPVSIDGLIYRTDHNSVGKLYEYWDDPVTGKHVWCRHHTTHGNDKNHTDPHDHEWKDDDNGNNKPGPPQPSNPNYSAPQSGEDENRPKPEIDKVVGTAVAIAVIYYGAKYLIAAIIAPLTGGGSLVAACLTP